MKDKQPRSKMQSSSKSSPKGPKGHVEDQTLRDRDLIGVNPLKEQFEPTEGSPYRQHFRMAGGD